MFHQIKSSRVYCSFGKQQRISKPVTHWRSNKPTQIYQHRKSQNPRAFSVSPVSFCYLAFLAGWTQCINFTCANMLHRATFEARSCKRFQSAHIEGSETLALKLTQNDLVYFVLFVLFCCFFIIKIET